MKECTYLMRKSCKIWNACSEAYSGGEDLPPCTKESQTTDTQHTQAKMLSWGEVTKGITFSTVGERDVAAEVFSRVARHFGCA